MQFLRKYRIAVAFFVKFRNMFFIINVINTREDGSAKKT